MNLWGLGFSSPLEPLSATDASSARQLGAHSRPSQAAGLRVQPGRLLLVAAAAMFVAVFHYTYLHVVVPIYEYVGHSYDPPPRVYVVVACVLAVIPSLWMPMRLKRPSQLLFLAQYFMVYVPALFVVHYTTNPVLTPNEGLQLNVLTFCGLSILQAQYLLPLATIRRIPVRDFWPILLSTAAILFIFVVLRLRGNFRLANLAEIYDVRDSMREMVESSGSTLVFYVLTWLAGFFLPFIVSVGARAHRWGLVVSVTAGYLFLFGITGTKSSLSACLFLPLIYLWLRFARRNTSAAFAVGLSALVWFPSFLGKWAPALGKWAIAIVNSRTFGSQPLLLAQYFSFFQTHPNTYLSHIRIVSVFVPYPYDERVSILIGRFAGTGANANSGFWAADGIGGFGPWGIIGMSVVVASLFWLLDSLSRPFDPRFTAVALGFISITFTNSTTSITLLSGGLGLLMLSLVLLPRQGILAYAFRDPPPESKRGSDSARLSPRLRVRPD